MAAAVSQAELVVRRYNTCYLKTQTGTLVQAEFATSYKPAND
jgi:hypothetical protein